MKMQYLESLQAFVTTEIRIWDPSQPPISYIRQNIHSNKFQKLREALWSEWERGGMKHEYWNVSGRVKCCVTV